MNESIKDKIANLKKDKEEFADLKELVKYLDIAGMKELATKLYELRFIFREFSSDGLENREEDFVVNMITTSNEYKKIKKKSLKLPKNLTITVKQYKDLYNLYLDAHKIINDMNMKGILQKKGEDLKNAVRGYFTQPKGYYYHYYYRAAGTYYILKDKEHLGYNYLEFYRNDNVSNDVRKNRR